MQTKALYILHIYINADYKKDDFSPLRLFCTPAGTHLLCQHMFATYYLEILLKSGFDFCLLSTQCFERQGRTSDKVKF